jgi:HEAT repeat protein
MSLVDWVQLAHGWALDASGEEAVIARQLEERLADDSRQLGCEGRQEALHTLLGRVAVAALEVGAGRAPDHLATTRRDARHAEELGVAPEALAQWAAATCGLVTDDRIWKPIEPCVLALAAGRQLAALAPADDSALLIDWAQKHAIDPSRGWCNPRALPALVRAGAALSDSAASRLLTWLREGNDVLDRGTILAAQILGLVSTPVFCSLWPVVDEDLRRLLASPARQELLSVTPAPALLGFQTRLAALLAERPCAHASELHFAPYIPMVRNPDPSVRNAGTHVLRQLAAVGAIPALAQHLDSGDVGVRLAVVDLFRSLGSPLAVPDLARAVRDRSALVRASAATALAAVEPRGAADIVEPLLGDGNALVRAAAAEALVATPAGRGRVAELAAVLDDPELQPQLGEDEAEARAKRTLIAALEETGDLACAPALVRRLRDNNGFVTESAERALVALGARAVADDVARLLDDPQDHVHRTAMRVLAGLGARQHAAAIAACGQAGRDYSRKEAAEAVATLGATEHGGDLVDFLRDETDGYIRETIVGAIVRLGSPSVVPALLACVAGGERAAPAAARALAGLHAVDELPALVELAAAPQPGARYAALEGIVALRGPAAVVARGLADPDATVRRQAAVGLSRLEAREAVAEIRPLLRDAHVFVRFASCQAVGRLGGEADIPAVAALLADDVPEVRRAAVDALAALRATDHVEAIAGQLGGADPFFQAAIAEALGALEASAATAKLIGLLLGDETDGELRAVAASALAARRDPTVADEIVARLGQPRWTIVEQALRTLATIGGQEHQSVFLRALVHPEWRVRCEAIDSLAKRGDHEAASRIARLLRDRVGFVRTAAVKALIRLEAWVPAKLVDLTVDILASN